MENQKLKILFLTARLPYPVIGGDRLKPNKIISYLAQNHDVTLVSFYQGNKPPKAYRQELEKLGINLEIILLNPVVAGMRSLKGLAGKKPLEILYYTQPEFRSKIIELTEKQNFDLAFAFFMRTAEYLKDLNMKKILMAEDCRTLYQKRSYEESNNLKQKAVRFWEYKKLQKYEPEIVNYFDITTLVTQQDINEMHHLNPTAKYRLLSNGTDVHHFVPPDDNVRKGILFAGKLDVWANQLMVNTIIQKILPKIRAKVPNVEFNIVGAKPPQTLLQYKNKENINIISDVPDMKPYLQNAQLFLHPHNGGSGIQNKLLEAMSCGCPVVTTTTGNQGINAVHNQDAMIGDTIDLLINHSVKLLTDREFANVISKNARELIIKTHSWESIYNSLDNIIMEVYNGN